MESYIFPLEDQQTYGARIQFSVHEVTPPSLADSRQATAKNTYSSTDGVDIGASAGTMEVLGQEADNAANFDEQKRMQAKLVENTLLSPLKISATPRARCTLYMPQSLQVQDGVSYENVELGVLGTAVKDLMSAGTGAMSAGSQAVGASLLNFLKGNSATGDAGRVALTRLTNIGPAAIAGGSRMALQTAPNPNVRAIFKSVNLREPSWQFKLIPKSERESEEIQQIITFFRENMYPEEITDNVAGTMIPIGYKFPDLFRVKMLYNNRERKEPVMQYKDMYLKSFTANFNSSGMGFYKGGNFSEVDITVNFIESETLSRKDVRSQSSSAGNSIISNFSRISNSGVT